MAEVIIPDRGSDEEEKSCLRCEGNGWTPYTAELFDGTTEQAFELCSCARDAVTERIGAEERRVLKAYRVFKTMGDEIISSYRKGVWWVPSASRPGRNHGVKFTRRSRSAMCSCEDYRINGTEECWHIIAARLAASESAPCGGCSKRFHRSKLSEVQGGDGMTFSPGEWVCPSCLARSGCEVAYWAAPATKKGS